MNTLPWKRTLCIPLSATFAAGLVMVFATTNVEAGKKKKATADFYFGMQHTHQGSAVLTPQPDGSLRVSNIGSSGKDGVSFDPGEVFGVQWEMADYSPSSSVACETIVCKMQRVELAIAGTTTEEFGFNFTKFPDNTTSLQPHLLNINPVCVRVEAFLNDQLVVAKDFATVPSQLGVIDFGPSPELGHLRGSLHRPPVVLGTWGATISRPSDPFQFQVESDPVSQLVTRVNIIYEDNPNESENPLYESVHISGMDSSGGTGCELNIHAEAIIHRDIASRALGDGRILGEQDQKTQNEHLVVSNIGSSGEDGVRFSNNPDENNDGVLDGFQLTYGNGPLIDGAPPVLLSKYTKFLADGTPTRCAVHHRDTGGGTGMRLEVEYEPSYRPSQVSIELRNNDAPVVVLDPVALSPGGLTDLGEIQDRANVRVEKFNVKQEFGPVQGTRYSNSITFVPNGQPSQICDEIIITPLNAPEIATEILSMDLSGQNLQPFSVGDITTVPADPKPVYFGIEHEDIGAAQTSLDKNGHLIVSNIGSSGKDGVSIDLTEVEGWAGEVNFGQAGALEPGMSITITARDQFDNPIPNFTVEEQGGGSAVGSFSWWDIDKPMTTRLFNDGVLVDEVTLPNSSFQPVVSGNIGSSGKDGVQFIIQYRETDFNFVTRLSSLTQLTLQGSPTGPVQADQLLIQVPSDSFDPIFELLDATGASLTQFSIWNEGLVQFEVPNRVLGQSTISGFICGNDPPVAKGLVIGNIGSSGCDGFSTDLRVADFDRDGRPDLVGALSVTGASSEDDGAIRTFVWRQLQGPHGSTTPIGGGSMTLTPGGGARDIAVDEILWWPHGPTSVSVYILNDNTLLTEAHGLTPGGNVATSVTPLLADTYVFELVVTDGSPTGVQHELRWDTLQDLGVSGQPPVSGNRMVLQVLGEKASAGIAGLGGPKATFDELEVLIDSDIPSDFVITNETAEALETCPADLDDDGDIDVDDLGEVFVNWGNAAADTNNDFVTDVDDLGNVFIGWGLCP